MSTGPKRGAMAQALRDTYTEELSLKHIQTWSEKTTKQLDELVQKLQKEIAAVQKSRGQAANNTKAAEATPASIYDLLLNFQAIGKEIVDAVQQIRLVISIRIPERKEEDNLGVMVQLVVMQELDKIQNAIVKGEKSGGDKEGVTPSAHMFVTRDYLAARGAIEDKVLNVNAGGKEAGGNKVVPPSLWLELHQIDEDYLLRTEIAATNINNLLRTFINTYALNWKKLIEPRNASKDRMVA